MRMSVARCLSADGRLPQLHGHLAQGADVASGSARGDTDCLQTGTAMTALIVAQPVQHSTLTGIAPDATVMPIRLVTAEATATASNAATAIEVATSAGATVIALGSYVDCADATVASALKTAVAHDVVVVCAAPTGSGRAAAPPGELRVGGVGVDGRSITAYQSGSVDVDAPGIDVASLGIAGAGAINVTGGQYAVAYAAGEAALVRAAFPQLTAAQVVNRVVATSDTTGPAATRAGGMINPGRAVTQGLPGEAPGGDAGRLAASSASTGSHTALLAVVTLTGLTAAVLLGMRFRKLVRGEVPERGDNREPSMGG